MLTYSNQTKGWVKKTPVGNSFLNHSIKYKKSPIQRIYTIYYYSGFYSSLKDKNCANGGHFEFSSKDEEKG